MSSVVRSSNTSFHAIPKIKLANSNTTNQMRVNLMDLCSKQVQLGESQKLNSPIKASPGQRSFQQQMYISPKEGVVKQPQKQMNETNGKIGVFSDYYNQQVVLGNNKLPQINRSTSQRIQPKPLQQSQQLEEGKNFAPLKVPRQKTNTLLSDTSAYDLNTNTSTQDIQEKQKGKSSFFRLKPPPLSIQKIVSKDVDQFSLSVNYNQMSNAINSSMQNSQLAFNTAEFDRMHNSTELTPKQQSETGLIQKKLQQQQNIRTLHEEQKRQLKRVEDITSPFPLKSQRLKQTGRMSLNLTNASEITKYCAQQNIISENIGGDQILRTFVSELFLSMRRNSFFDIFLEEYQENLSEIQERVRIFILNVFSDNHTAIKTLLREFMETFNALSNANVFECKNFLLEFLTCKEAVNNTFIDKNLAFRLIDMLETYRTEITANEDTLNIYEVSACQLADQLVEYFVTSEFFKRFDLEKLSLFSKNLVDLLFNKISATEFVSLFESIFQASLTPSYVNIFKDSLKKALVDMKEYNSLFRKHISYQLKKVQWLIPSQQHFHNYIDVVHSVTDIYTVFSSLAQQLPDAHLFGHIQFANFLKLFYNKNNIFNMIDMLQIIDPKHPDISKQCILTLSVLFKQALITKQISPEVAKKIETFTLSIFD